MNAIDEQAVNWLARLDGDPRNMILRADLESWLSMDSRHRGAYLRAEAAWTGLDRLAILPRTDAMSATRGPSRRRVMATGGGLVAVSTTAISAILWFSSRGRIATPIGEIRRVPLNDGSVVALNTDSAVEIHLKKDARLMTLDKGEAWFSVAKDRKRPFVVLAGSVQVRAIGTAFSVRRRDDGADVLVTEGIVDTWTTDAPARRLRLVAGSQVFVSDIAGPSQVITSSAQIDRTLAWRAGEIMLAGQTLGAAADEFNRYNHRRLTIDPSFANKRLVGWFHTNEPETFAHAAAETFGIAVTASDDEIHLGPKTIP